MAQTLDADSPLAADPFATSPFTRLARVHAFSVSTDTLVTVSLAGTLFFSIPSGAARDKVALYLLLTMAPFAVVAPLVGPAIDRSRAVAGSWWWWPPGCAPWCVCSW